MRIDMQPAFVLHTRPYRDTSLLVDFLTRDHGLLRAVARGVAGSSKRSKTRMMSFQPYLVTLSGKTELLSLYQSEYAGNAITLKSDPLFSAMYLNELLVRTLQVNEGHAHVFIRYGQALSGLQSGHAIESVLRRFEWRLLEELGYGIDTDDLDPALSYDFEDAAGLVFVDHETVPGLSFPGHLLQRFACWVEEEGDRPLEDELASFAKVLMRRRLAPLLGDKPLLSRKLFLAKKPPAPGASYQG
ncbi:DNA repair protein RecO [Pseudohongiella nitratireducens]|uniref:DNA repair protein RecO n=1 Tax=Pseudohongiella nitratireducens TaxID=1768907 RepID=UPI0030EEDC75|tara:strand:+ start:13368 stop:14099 length:732 start_codon:yes stop_codon:yes gene_type:complete